jgi:hypothetical protein
LELIPAVASPLGREMRRIPAKPVRSTRECAKHGRIGRTADRGRTWPGTSEDPQAYLYGMRRDRLAPLTVVAAVAVLLIPLAEAKFRISVTIEPARPIAVSPARVIMRTEIALAREHGIRMHAVGPWRRGSGQAFFEVRLVRIGPRTLRGSVRFPYPGRWHLNVPASGASPPVDRWVRVRPRA